MRESFEVHAAAAAISAPGAVGPAFRGLNPGFPVRNVVLNLCFPGLPGRSDFLSGAGGGGSLLADVEERVDMSVCDGMSSASELDLLSITAAVEWPGEDVPRGGSGGRG